MFRIILQASVIFLAGTLLLGLSVARRRLEERRLADDPAAQAAHIIRASRRGR